MTGRSYTAVIPTAGDRPCLDRCVEAVQGQSQPPTEILLVAAKPAERPAWLPSTVRFVTAPASTAGQRNLGARLARHDLVLFVDDDNVLDAGFAAHLLAAWRLAGPGVAGVTGVIDNDPRLPRGQNLLYCVLGLGHSAFRARASRLRWSGHVLSVYDPPGDTSAGFLHCCCTMYMRELLLTEPFDETFAEYALGEDLDLAARMATRGLLLQVRQARSRSADVDSTAPRDPYEIGRCHGEVLAFFRWRHRGPGAAGTLCWFAANLGQILILISRGVTSGSWAALHGYLHGLRLTHRRILSGQCRRWLPRGRRAAAGSR